MRSGGQRPATAKNAETLPEHARDTRACGGLRIRRRAAALAHHPPRQAGISVRDLLVRGTRLRPGCLAGSPAFLRRSSAIILSVILHDLAREGRQPVSGTDVLPERPFRRQEGLGHRSDHARRSANGRD
jgi:hypothetical protein